MFLYSLKCPLDIEYQILNVIPMKDDKVALYYLPGTVEWAGSNIVDHILILAYFCAILQCPPLLCIGRGTSFTFKIWRMVMLSIKIL